MCGDDWDVLLSVKNGHTLAAMPLYLPCKGVISMPHYTQSMGIWFAADATDVKYSSVLEHRQAICKEFIARIGRYRVFLQNFDHSFTDWLPFYWAGYSQTTRYTYILYNIKNSETILAGMSQQTRRNLKSAENKHIEVRMGLPIEDFLKIQNLTFERQNCRNTQSPVVMRRLVETARRREQGEIFGGYDRDGCLHAAAFVVWQPSSAYYIAGGGDPSLRHSGAHTLVLWEAIRHASQYTDHFDFEGSMLPGVERFFREFGAVQTPYFMISKAKLTILDRVKIKLKMRRL